MRAVRRSKEKAAGAPISVAGAAAVSSAAARRLAERVAPAMAPEMPPRRDRRVNMWGTAPALMGRAFLPPGQWEVTCPKDQRFDNWFSLRGRQAPLQPGNNPNVHIAGCTKSVQPRKARDAVRYSAGAESGSAAPCDGGWVGVRLGRVPADTSV